MLKARKIWIDLIASLSLFLPVILLAADEQALVVILSGSESQPYQVTQTGIVATLRKRMPGIQIEEHQTDGSDAEFQSAIGAISAKDPTVVVVLGAKALQAFRALDTETPVVASLVSDSSIVTSFQYTTGITLEFSLGSQLEVLRELLPSAKRYGMLFDPQSNQDKVDEAGKLLAAKGLSFVAAAVSTPAELPGSLESMSRRVDVIWGIPDPVAMNSRTAKPVLVESFRKNVALIGPTPSWTRAGALCSLEWNYRDIGLQAAEFAIEIINGSPAQSLPVSSPRTINYSLNLRTADQINIRLEEAHIGNATRVYE